MSGLAAASAPSIVDRAVKRRRVLDVLERRGAESIVLRSHTAVAWYLDGVRTHVSLAGDPVAAVVVRRDGDELLVFDNEADRLAAEELGPSLDLGVTRVPWHDVLVPADAADLDEADAAPDLRAARASLLPGELARYRALCREVAEVLTDAATAARPDDAERDVAARLAADLVARGIDPLVTLVAGRSRLAHRHPLPTAAPIGDRAMLVVCGRRHGLIANATRWVRWGASATDVGCRAPHPRRRGGVPRRHLGRRDGRRGVRGRHRGLRAGRIRPGGVAPPPPGRRGRIRGPRPAGHARRHRSGAGRPGLRVEPHRAGRQGRGHGARARRRHRGADGRPALADGQGRRLGIDRSNSTV